MLEKTQDCDGHGCDDGDTVAVEATVGGGGPGDGDTGAGSGGSGGEDGDEGVHELDLPSKIGHFAFFLAEFSPAGSCWQGRLRLERLKGRKDVQVHWYTPVKNNLRSSAASVAFGDYCNTRVGSAGDFVLVDAPGGRSKRVPDLGWESVDGVVVWSKHKQLNGQGKKLPKYAVDAVFQAYQHTSILAYQQRNKQGGGRDAGNS